MKVLIQRCSSAKVEVNKNIRGEISTGMMILVGISVLDTQEDIDYLVKKIINLRIFEDDQGVMNLSINDVNGEILLVSQFTLQATTKKGNRPSYINAARPEQAIPLYQTLINQLQHQLQTKIKTGEFGAHMQVSLTNNGPVTIIIDSKNK